MNVKIPIGIVLVMAAVLGYLLGTEAGRQQRDGLLSRIRREEAIDDVVEAVEEAVTEAAATETVSTEDSHYRSHGPWF